MKTMNTSADQTQVALRANIREFAEQEIAPLAHEIDVSSEFPQHLWQKFGALGVLGITVDASYGGTAQGYVAQAIAMEEISRASAAVGLSYAAHANLCVNQIYLNGTTEQKVRYLPGLISGEKVGALAMSEPEAGSDVVSMQLQAKQVGEHYVLNGEKMWITNGAEADILVVYAKTDLEAGSRGISSFMIERDFPGFSRSKKLDKLGMRGSSTCALHFNQCQVSEHHIIGKKNQGVEVLMRGLDYERVILAAGAVGIMQACMDLVLPYVKKREQFGQPIGKFQLIQAKLADMYTRLHASRAYTYQIAQHCDQGHVTREDAASVILFAAENATQTALDAIQCLGGNGYLNDYPAGRLLRDAKLYEIGAGTSEIRRMLIGRELFKKTK